jgi:hypothetical protein
MRKILTVLIFIIIAISLYSYETRIQRAGVVLREGPGSYYPVVKDLATGTKVDVIAEEENWLKISCSDGGGYVPSNALEAQEEMSSNIEQLARLKTNMISSPASESAGIKGLANDFSKLLDSRPVDLNYIADYNIDPKLYDKFRKKTYKGINLNRIWKQVQLPKRKSPAYFTTNEQAFGLAVAAGIAGNGLLKDPELTEYINFVGNNIVEASDMADVHFRFFVLSTNKLGAWSCPGGYIFVTAGLVKLLDNEAELAGVLAHEIAHVSAKHGMSHYEVVEANNAAEDAFSRLDGEIAANFGTNSDAAKTEQELNQEARSYFRLLIDGMLDEFEIEADYLGAVYTVRAGYSPEGFKSMLLKIQDNLSRATNNHFSKGNISTRRLGAIDKSINKINAPSNLLYLRDRFEEVKIRL